MANITDNFNKVKDDIRKACKSAFRNSDSVCLVAVSKGHDFAKIEELYVLGQRHFAESYAVEFQEKYERALFANFDIVWHFIGAIQSNKLKLIKNADVIQSVSTLRHARLLNQSIDKPIDIFLQINPAQNPHQQGMSDNLAEIIAVISALGSLKNLRLRGLMTIAPSNFFPRLLEIKNALLAQKVAPKIELSMGMSNDFVAAIKSGADLLRVGTRIFGER